MKREKPIQLLSLIHILRKFESAEKEECLCLNDQGGERMDVSVDVTATLRAGMSGQDVYKRQHYHSISEDRRYCDGGGGEYSIFKSSSVQSISGFSYPD